MQQKIKECALNFLRDGTWKYAGTISQHVGYKTEHKPSTVERMLRVMAQEDLDPILEAQYVPNPSGRGPKVVQYRLKLEGQSKLF